MTINEQIKQLSSDYHYLGGDSFNMLMELSAESDALACYIDDFLLLTQQDNSYFRIRGVRLISENMKWLDEETGSNLLLTVLEMLNDEKPIVVRKVLESLYTILSNCPYSAKIISCFLVDYSYSNYSDAMRPIIKNDIAKIINKTVV